MDTLAEGRIKRGGTVTDAPPNKCTLAPLVGSGWSPDSAFPPLSGATAPPSASPGHPGSGAEPRPQPAPRGPWRAYVTWRVSTAAHAETEEARAGEGAGGRLRRLCPHGAVARLCVCRLPGAGGGLCPPAGAAAARLGASLAVELATAGARAPGTRLP